MRKLSICTFVLANVVVGSAAAQNTQFVPTQSLFASAIPTVTTTATTMAVAGDLEGDGDLDLVFGRDPGSGVGSSIGIFRNGELEAPPIGTEAYGTFVDLATPSITTQDRIFDIQVLDAEGDGDLDIVYVTDTVQGAPVFTQVALLRQVAPGVFSAPQFVFSSTTAIPVTAEIADMNGDAQPDIVLGTVPALNQNGQGVVIMTNNGGSFTQMILGPAYGGMSTAALAVGDIDSDGDMDIVCGNRAGQFGGSANALYRNNGGVFSATTAGVPGASNTLEVVLADIDGNPFLDLVVADQSGTKTVHSGTSAGFGGAVSSFGGTGLCSGVAADIDEDGDVDVVFGNSGSSTQVLLNSGTALALAPTRITPDGGSHTTVLADLDRDGDLDVVQGLDAGASHNVVRAQINLHRQIDAPPTAPLGQVYTIDIYDRPGYGNGFVGTLHLSQFRIVPRFFIAPLGFLGINPNPGLILTLPTNPSGKVSLPIPIPNDPNLLPNVHFWQWVIAPTGSGVSDWRLTNVLPVDFI